MSEVEPSKIYDSSSEEENDQAKADIQHPTELTQVNKGREGRPGESGDILCPPAFQSENGKDEEAGKQTQAHSSQSKTHDEEKESEEFDFGLEPEEIVGARLTKNRGVEFLMKWRGRSKCSLVPASKANIICPQVVIKFYEEHLIWEAD